MKPVTERAAEGSSAQNKSLRSAQNKLSYEVNVLGNLNG